MRDLVIGAIGVVIAVTAGTAGAQTIERVSVSSDGTEANGDSFAPRSDTISADGRYVVFESDASNLVAADSNGATDVFLRDRSLGTTIRVSEAWDGGDASGASRYPSISEDGRWVAFSSDAPNIVVGDTNGVEDVFLFDRQTGQISRISVAWDGGQTDGLCHTPSISGDGRYVAFRGGATNLLVVPILDPRSVYVRDLQTGVNLLASVTWDGVQEDGGSWYPHISANGRHVAFISNSTTLAPFDENGVNDVFMRDLDSNQTTMVSTNIDGEDANDHSGGFGISADGRFVGMFSRASDLLPPGEDTNGVADAFVRDRSLGVTERVSVSTSGVEGNGISGSSTLDSSGRYAAFHSDASNLVAGDGNATTDIFGRDRERGETTLLTFTATGEQADGSSERPTLSADGCFVVFNSTATNLVSDDTNGFWDVFIGYGPATILADGFEAGNTSRWTTSIP